MRFLYIVSAWTMLATAKMAGQELVSPAQKQIALAEVEIQKAPTRASGYNRLALANARRARETSDVSYYRKGEEALEKSFEVEPGNLEGRKSAAWIALGKHEFEQALAMAQKMNAAAPDDITIYGILADANVELGNYDAAETAVQTMFKLRPPTVPSLTRGAYLRELLGDSDGAIELMTKAFEMAGYEEREDRAWMLTQIAQLERKRGKAADAERLLGQALQLFPNYHYALGALARLRLDAGKFREAVEIEQKRYAMAPHAENLYALAVAQKRAGMDDAAQASFHQFEIQSRAETQLADNSNHELTFYYADFSDTPVEALAIATAESKRRHDVFTLDAYAWALFANGRHEEAKREMKRALVIGVKDPDILAHAEAILKQ